MKKHENGMMTFITFLFTYIIQKVLTRRGLINTDHLVMDFISWVVIFVILHFIVKKLFYVTQNS